MVRDLCSKRTAADKIMNKMNENRKIVLDTLNEQNIEYEMFEHQAVYTVDEIEDSDLWNHENGIGAKNLFLRDGSGKHHFLVIIREDICYIIDFCVWYFFYDKLLNLVDHSFGHFPFAVLFSTIFHVM